MIFISFNHRGLGEGGMPTGTGAVGAALFNAFSRGELHLASPDPQIDPIVEENMLAHPDDLLRMRDAVRRLRALAAQPALADLADAITVGDSALSFDEANKPQIFSTPPEPAA
jgi:choline dehydrogenase